MVFVSPLMVDLHDTLDHMGSHGITWDHMGSFDIT